MNFTGVKNLLDTTSYSSIKKKITDKKHSLQFLPSSLQKLAESKTFIYKDKKLKSSYVIDIVHSLILKYYFKKDNKFSLMATILKEKYGYLYNYYMDYLVDNKVLVLLSKHKKGKSSRVYAISESILRGNINRFQNSDKILLKRYKEKILSLDEVSENSLIDNSIKSKLVEDLFHVEIEFDRSIFFLDTLKQDDIDIYNRNRYSVECINDKHIFYHFDNYGRMHTNFTILKSFIRKNCLLIDGEETVEIDIKNSQPLFLTKLIDEVGMKWIDNQEFELFKDLTVNGLYYSYFMSNNNIKDKSLAKEMTYKVLFGRNSSNSKPDKLFSSLFPTIHNFIKNYKKENGDYRILAYDLQKAESNLIFNKIIKQIISFYPDVRIVTVHDSLIVQKKHKDSVWSIFRTKLLEELNII